MFGIGSTELLVILVVALIVLGPKTLASLSKTLGKAMGEFRRVSTDFQRTLNAEAAQEEHEEHKRAEAAQAAQPMQSVQPGQATPAAQSAQAAPTTQPTAPTPPAGSPLDVAMKQTAQEVATPRNGAQA